MGIICAEMSLVDAVRHAALRTKQVRIPSHSKMSQPKAAHPRGLHHGSPLRWCQPTSTGCPQGC